MKWSTIYKANLKGGIGVGVLSFALLNKAHLCKWYWHYSCEMEMLWKKVIGGKHGEEEGGWLLCGVRHSCRVGLWKAMSKE